MKLFKSLAAIAVALTFGATSALADGDDEVRAYAGGSSGFVGGSVRYPGSDYGAIYSRGNDAISTSAQSDDGETGSARVTGYFEHKTGAEALDIWGDHNSIGLESNSRGDVGGEAIVERNGHRETDDAFFADGISSSTADGEAEGDQSVVMGATYASNRGAGEARANLPGRNADEAESRSYAAGTTRAAAADDDEAMTAGRSTANADALTSEVESDQ